MTYKDLDERKQKILNAIIQDYQYSAEPVGSRTISRSYLPELSPATIRNEMADLEEEGFITQPHTSAGRIPTDSGYRFYVDRLMKAVHPSHREEELIKTTIHRKSLNLDEILHQTAKLLSHALDYSTIVVNHSSNRRIFAAGTSNLLHQPEFRNLEKMQKMLELFEEDELLAELVDEYIAPEDITVRIGSENKIKAIRSCSVVVRSFEINNEPVGGIGLIGPTRMYYSKATSLVDYVAKELSNVLSQGDIF
ncbi:MAG: heat-inducible transcriptional repressor HrcA [Candidatus Margulisbacteria bacterium]|nr:heat-inducible transcriptional repressor HrcA [Candidatus Margulisiibacteriota bacterium]